MYYTIIAERAKKLAGQAAAKGGTDMSQTSLGVEWLGQAVFIYRFPSGLVICVDPYLSYAASGGKSRERLLPVLVAPSHLAADLVITTHDHTDHFDEMSLRPLAERTDTLFLGPTSCREHWLAMEMPPARFLALDQGQTLEAAGARLTALPAEHSSGAKRDAIGILIEAEGYRLYQVGDSEYTPAVLEAATDLRPDLMAVPINGRLGNMDHQQAALLAQATQPRVVVPMHYGMFRNNNADPQDFVSAARAIGLPSRIAIMKPGRRFDLEPA